MFWSYIWCGVSFREDILTGKTKGFESLLYNSDFYGFIGRHFWMLFFFFRFSSFRMNGMGRTAISGLRSIIHHILRCRWMFEKDRMKIKCISEKWEEEEETNSASAYTLTMKYQIDRLQRKTFRNSQMTWIHYTVDSAPLVLLMSKLINITTRFVCIFSAEISVGISSRKQTNRIADSVE